MGGGYARACVSALGFESTTGGAGKAACVVLRELSKVRYPGDDDDPVTVKLRAAWRTRMLRYHTFALLKHRYNLAVRKRFLILSALTKRYGDGICPPLSKAQEWGVEERQRRASCHRSRGPRGGG